MKIFHHQYKASRTFLVPDNVCCEHAYIWWKII